MTRALQEVHLSQDLPQRLAAAQRREQLDLRLGEPEQLTRPVELVGRLGVDDAGLRIREQSLSKSRLAGTFGAGRTQI